METGFFSLDLSSGNRFTRLFQIVFGVICLAVAIIWLFLNINEIRAIGSFWITLLFLAGFGVFQIRSGMGLASRFIEIGNGKIRLRKNSFMPSRELLAEDIEKIEFFPLTLIFFMKKSKAVILRFGTTYTDIIDPVRRKTEEFASLNGIEVEEKTEEF